MRVDKANAKAKPCMTDLRGHDDSAVLMDLCGKPSVVTLTNWAGRTESLCLEHARELGERLAAVVKEAEGKS